MTAFNTLQVRIACSRCGAPYRAEVQFRYGDTWQHVYAVGDRLSWGGNDVGVPGAGRVRVEGLAGPCPACGTFVEVDIFIEQDVIAGAAPTQDRDEREDGFEILPS